MSLWDRTDIKNENTHSESLFLHVKPQQFLVWIIFRVVNKPSSFRWKGRRASWPAFSQELNPTLIVWIHPACNIKKFFQLDSRTTLSSIVFWHIMKDFYRTAKLSTCMATMSLKRKVWFVTGCFLVFSQRCTVVSIFPSKPSSAGFDFRNFLNNKCKR